MNAPTAPSLEVKEISKRYSISKKQQVTLGQKYKVALNKVSFTLTPGIYGILGPNGAGKSTLISIVTGGLIPDKGKVLWQGKSILRLRRKYRRILGYMPQQQGLYDSFTGRQFLYYMAALKEVPGKNATKEILCAAQTVNLTQELDKKLAAYSGGMKQRLLLAAALLGDPQFLVLDEPTAGLDPQERVRLRNFLAKLAENRIILLATHVVSDVENIAKEILLLRHGELLAQDTPANLIKKYCPNGNLEQVYLTAFEESEYATS